MSQRRKSGLSIIEIIVAMGIFLIIVASGATIVIAQFSSNRLSEEESIATLHSQEGIEAVRSIKNQDWFNLAIGTHGIDNTGGNWIFSGISDSLGKFTRQIIVEQVQRNVAGDIVASGGTIDPDSLKVTSTVNWDFTSSRNNTVDLITYLTNFGKSIISVSGWANPLNESSLSLDKNNDSKRVQVRGNYAYIIREDDNTDFEIVDITDTSNPIEIATSFIDLPGDPSDIALYNDYAFITSFDDTAEIQVIDISDPTNPSYLASSSIDLPDTANANGISIQGDYAYVVRDQFSGEEFHTLDISTPTAPFVTGSEDLTLGNNNDVVVIGSTAYIASDFPLLDLKTVSINIPILPLFSVPLNLGGVFSSDAISIAGEGNTVVVGAVDGTLSVVNVHPPVFQGSLNLGAQINDISIGPGNLLFAGTDNNSQEFQVIDITNQSAPILFGSYDLGPPNNLLKGLDYHVIKDRVIAVGIQNSNELVIFEPSP